MNRLKLLFTFLLFSETLISQNKEIPFEISFNQSLRFDDRFLIELNVNNKEIIFEKDTKDLSMPFFNETFYVVEKGQYCLHTNMTTDDFKDSLSKKHCFDVTGNEEKISIKIIIDWDTLSRKPLSVYRSNKITVNKTVNFITNMMISMIRRDFTIVPTTTTLQKKEFLLFSFLMVYMKIIMDQMIQLTKLNTIC